MNNEWKVKTLEEVSDFVRGLTYTKKDEVEFSNNVVLRANNIDVATNKLDFTELKYINNDINVPFSKIVKENALIICTASGSKKHLGKIALIDKDYGYAFGGFMGQLIPKENILPKFLFYRLISDTYRSYIDKLSAGVNINNLRFDSLRCFKIPLPSFPEQKRIVKSLDEAFSAIDKAKVNAENNLRNSRELFDSHLNKAFANPGEDWEEKKLKETAKVIGGYSFKSSEFKNSGKYQVIRMGNVRPGTIRPDENPVFVDSLDEKILNRAQLLPNDVIITQTGTKKKRDYGYTAIVDSDNYLLNQRIASIRFPDYYLPKFFLYYSWTNSFKDQYFSNETGTVGQGNVGINAITDALVPFCKLSEQIIFVKKIDELILQTKKLENTYQQKLNDLEELKKSILQKAFDGEL